MLLSFTRIDSEGNVNMIPLAAKPHVTSGIGDFPNITSHVRYITFIGFLTTGDFKVGLRGQGIHRTILKIYHLLPCQ